MSTWKIVLLVTFLVFIIVGSMSKNANSEGVSINGKEAQRLVKDGALLLDVRTPGEFNQQHIPGSLNIPVQQLKSRLEELGEKSKTIVVYCRSGARSGRAAKMLMSVGFEKVHDLGAMSAW